MYSTVQKWGNSQGIRIPKKILDSANIKNNELVKIEEYKGHILIKKAVKEYASLDELFEGYEGNYKSSEYNFGENVGREKI